MGQEADVRYYESFYRGRTIYDLPPAQSPYSPLFKRIIAQLNAGPAVRVLEVGCGSGALASLIMARTAADYHGFDFSATAVAKAVARTGRPDAFYVADATDGASYGLDYDTVVCTEVLEHIEGDKGAIGLWGPNTRCICSVPNFDYDGHVRFFRTEAEVRNRYHDVIAIDHVVRVPRPVFAGETLGDYLRKLRWSRDDPRRLLGLLGIRTFDAIGGWVLFDGTTPRRAVRPAP